MPSDDILLLKVSTRNAQRGFIVSVSLFTLKWLFTLKHETINRHNINVSAS